MSRRACQGKRNGGEPSPGKQDPKWIHAGVEIINYLTPKRMFGLFVRNLRQEAIHGIAAKRLPCFHFTSQGEMAIRDSLAGQ